MLLTLAKHTLAEHRVNRLIDERKLIAGLQSAYMTKRDRSRDRMSASGKFHFACRTCLRPSKRPSG